MSGFLGLVSHCASSSRPLWFGLIFGASGTWTRDKKPRGTTGPSFSASPRMRNGVSPIVLASRIPMATGMPAIGSASASHCFSSLFILSRATIWLGRPSVPTALPCGVLKMALNSALALS